MKILGPAALRAYQTGAVKLEDFVGRSQDKRWGTMRHARSLRDILGADEAKKHMSARVSQPAGGSSPAGRGSAGAGGGHLPAERAIRQIEDQIRRNPAESLHAVDASGRVVLSKLGTQNEVVLDPTDLALLRDTIVTHNHPGGLVYLSSDPRSQGNSFSREDIMAASQADVVEMRAVTPVWRFIVRRPAVGWGDWGRDLSPVFSQHRAAVTREFQEAVWVTHTMTQAEAEAQFSHEVWTRVSQELGLDYRREP
ncbi:MAG: hypothetical protein HY675_13085 [Chloroflexi bacterium]|nr:hypothetical protein [Chloroflexota bacterium]